MEDTNTLIKDIAVDIIAITSIWGIINHTYQANHPYAIIHRIVNDDLYYYSLFSAFGLSLYFIRKYK